MIYTSYTAHPNSLNIFNDILCVCVCVSPGMHGRCDNFDYTYTENVQVCLTYLYFLYNKQNRHNLLDKHAVSDIQLHITLLKLISFSFFPFYFTCDFMMKNYLIYHSGIVFLSSLTQIMMLHAPFPVLLAGISDVGLCWKSFLLFAIQKVCDDFLNKIMVIRCLFCAKGVSEHSE